MIEARIVADSIGPSGVRLTTFVLTYPRFIHSEFMTHRMLSKNAASSRAIPCKKMRAAVKKEAAMPVSFSQNKAGMQAAGDVAPWKQKAATILWKLAGRVMCGFHWALEKLGIHKQHANRILEPWLHMTVIVTGTEWANFFALRCHAMAQPEFQVLAREMRYIYYKTIPNKLKAGQWHLPFVDDEEVEMEELEQSVEPRGGPRGYIRKSVARCARVSYMTHEGKKPSFLEDFQLYDRLVGSAPIHASPAEHQAQATKSKKFSGNLRGWKQYRKTIKGENVKKFVPGS
jgi:hypothetical protein